jgi:hypothetical protein
MADLAKLDLEPTCLVEKHPPLNLIGGSCRASAALESSDAALQRSSSRSGVGEAAHLDGKVIWD